jgi:hypothetical protein
MKKNMIISIIAIALISIVSCTKETKNPAPTLDSISVAENVVTVTFSEAVYANNDMTGALTNSNISVTIPDVVFTYTVAHTAGSPSATVTLDITSIVPENTQISVTTTTAIYDDKGEVLLSNASASADMTADLGIIGRWQSSGDNVAPLLATYFLVDSISAEFKTDLSYVVHQFSNGNTSTTPDVVFSGTFTLERSGVDNIWDIVIVQELPYSADASGIFEIKIDPEILWYEVVQTSGTQNIPPTAEAGFGSTNGGAFGTTNIQKYVRL